MTATSGGVLHEPPGDHAPLYAVPVILHCYLPRLLRRLEAPRNWPTWRRKGSPLPCTPPGRRPQATYDTVLRCVSRPPGTDLVVEPGKQVIEHPLAGMHKGIGVVEQVVEESTRAASFHRRRPRRR